MRRAGGVQTEQQLAFAGSIPLGDAIYLFPPGMSTKAGLHFTVGKYIIVI
jgi:hypothetical protein